MPWPWRRRRTLAGRAVAAVLVAVADATPVATQPRSLVAHVPESLDRLLRNEPGAAVQSPRHRDSRHNGAGGTHPLGYFVHPAQISGGLRTVEVRADAATGAVPAPGAPAPRGAAEKETPSLSKARRHSSAVHEAAAHGTDVHKLARDIGHAAANSGVVLNSTAGSVGRAVSKNVSADKVVQTYDIEKLKPPGKHGRQTLKMVWQTQTRGQNVTSSSRAKEKPDEVKKVSKALGNEKTGKDEKAQSGDAGEKAKLTTKSESSERSATKSTAAKKSHKEPWDKQRSPDRERIDDEEHITDTNDENSLPSSSIGGRDWNAGHDPAAKRSKVDPTGSPDEDSIRRSSVHGEPPDVADPSPPRALHEPNYVQVAEGIFAVGYDHEPEGTRELDQEMTRRLSVQDLSVLSLLLFVFLLTILIGLGMVYAIADDPSPVMYYSDFQMRQRLFCESNRVVRFLESFNHQPQNVRLRLIGRRSNIEGPSWLSRIFGERDRRSSRRNILFDVTLDLTSFICSTGELYAEDLPTLQRFLSSSNLLETFVIEKRVEWKSWEDLATNIRQKLRALGFTGNLEVRFEASDEITIYKNHRWPNFVRNSATNLLIALSIIGPFIWIPYVYCRSRSSRCESWFRIDIEPVRYWQLIEHSISASEGFRPIAAS